MDEHRTDTRVKTPFAEANPLPAAPACPPWCEAHDRPAAPQWDQISRAGISRDCATPETVVTCEHGNIGVELHLSRFASAEPNAEMAARLGMTTDVEIFDPEIRIDGLAWSLGEFEQYAAAGLRLVARARGVRLDDLLEGIRQDQVA